MIGSIQRDLFNFIVDFMQDWNLVHALLESWLKFPPIRLTGTKSTKRFTSLQSKVFINTALLYMAL